MAQESETLTLRGAERDGDDTPLADLEARVEALERRTCIELLLPASVRHHIGLVTNVIFYMAASAGMMIVNKLVLRGSHLPITVVIVQMLFTVGVLVAVPGMRNSLHFGSAMDAWRWARAVPPLFAMMLVSSMLALDYASMGALVVVRNLAPVPALISEGFIDRTLKVDPQTVLAISTSLAGVLLYAKNDLSSSSIGLLFMALNLFAAVAERVVQRKLIALDPIDVSKQGMMMINNGVGAVLLIPLMAAFGELGHLHELAAFDARQWGLLLLSCINGVAISYAGIAVQQYVTASTFLVLTNSNKFAVIAFGIFVLGEARAWQAVLGCVVALAGGVWYGKARAELDSTSKQERTHAAPDGRAPSRFSPLRCVQAAVVGALLLFALSGRSGASTAAVDSSAALVSFPAASVLAAPSAASPHPSRLHAATSKPATSKPATSKAARDLQQPLAHNHTGAHAAAGAGHHITHHNRAPRLDAIVSSGS